jgi:hypothetical protein
LNYRLTLKSRNAKTGPIPVSTTSSGTCPDACPFKAGNGCYAEASPSVADIWRETDAGQFSTDLHGFTANIAALPEGTLWRHNQAGDLPGEGNVIDQGALQAIVDANAGRKGFTYIHKPVDTGANANNAIAIAAANSEGFTINLSANNLAHADQLAGLRIAPVVVVLPSAIQGNVRIATPQGRRVVVCPATYRANITCASCGLCQVRDRKVIVGFPAHGAGAKKASAVASA